MPDIGDTDSFLYSSFFGSRKVHVAYPSMALSSVCLGPSAIQAEFRSSFIQRQYGALADPLPSAYPSLSVILVNFMPSLLHSLAAAHRER